jgi:hypothetical protein
MENKKFLSNLEQSDWYEFIHLILKYSHEVAEKIKVSKQILLHFLFIIFIKLLHLINELNFFND